MSSLANIAIEVAGVEKAFRLPHEQRTTFKEYFLHPLRHTTFERQRALSGVTFAVEEGEFFGIIGPNGSGKSTLLKVLAGIYRQDAGTVRVNGVLSPFIELGVGFNPELTGRDNIRINATLLGLTRRQIRERFDEIVGFGGLERFIDQKLKNFSSGMQVRLAYSIAIQVDFDILMLDEVLAVGDQEFQERCFETLAAIREAGKTIVFVSHDLGAIRDHCDRAMLLLDGSIRAIGKPDDVLSRYDAIVHPVIGART
ncbi:ABC-type polysaccharide/polyol phosphate transport system ATPase component [Gaiella occulta]|uniref:ABC-type polysaccharide/polyol phosphate transport system ATPase component n=1 Tax=Gaiella occulta TaxID=1002870 RepID=A0A7M2YWJ6_9ACTN|nr:ABC transporter ATP-binding protein [Gaiella occulta]RDI74264.1 ABC-type polysaccharide/polyol phosphate transport system ATPase component [Gaiella occulta]